MQAPVLVVIETPLHELSELKRHVFRHDTLERLT